MEDSIPILFPVGVFLFHNITNVSTYVPGYWSSLGKANLANVTAMRTRPFPNGGALAASPS